MGKEIERKFLVKTDEYRKLAKGVEYRQGYLNSARNRTVRIRTAGSRAFLTIKGATQGMTRIEYEYEIPLEDCNFMLDNLAEKPLIEKKRYKIPMDGFIWVIDEFSGANAGLVVAEIELRREDQKFPVPDWIGEEVTGDSRYYNSNLIKNPYRDWK